MPFYVVDENNNLVEAFDKEGFLALLEQAIAEGTLEEIMADSAFVTKLRCCVSGQTNKIAFVTEATYNELAANEELQPNCYYFITDDSTCDNIDKQLNTINERIDSLQTQVGNGFNSMNNIINNLQNDINNRRKIEDAWQLVSTNDALLYDDSVSVQEQIDLSSKIKEGKTGSDIIGLAGRLTINLGSKSYDTYFSCLKNGDSASNGFKFQALFGGADLNGTDNIYFSNICMTMNSDNKLYCQYAYATNINLKTKCASFTININNLNVYYK